MNTATVSRGLKLPIELGSSLPTGATKNVVELLGRRIINDEYPQGQVIPTEEELAVSLGISRATVRDAIKVLSGKGLLQTARRYGTKVRPIEEWHLLDIDVASWHEPDHPRIGQMFAETTELRCVIEPAAAAFAAERATEQQIDTIVEAAHAMHPDEEDVQTLFAADCLFHSTVLEATGNLMMRQMRPMILTVLQISYEFGVLIVDGERVTREGHIRVADAIRARNARTARAEMEHMLELNRDTASRYWEILNGRV
ncbi:MAG: FadR family transcriptional regulator [Rhizobiaceae bacterium]|nr:FadR family transcriptional regulator [Rhizobiaceae bacterium]